jgi:hypothetical protein
MMDIKFFSTRFTYAEKLETYCWFGLMINRLKNYGQRLKKETSSG